MRAQKGFFDEDDRLNILSRLGDSLEKLNKVVDFEIFRHDITAVFEKKSKGSGGRPPFDYVMMFKIVVLQRIYNLSDDQMEFQLNDRLSFMRFVGLGIGDKIPDAKTIWHFKNELTKAGIGKRLFECFHSCLEKKGIIQNEGRIVDATFIDAPRQRNNHDENVQIKAGKVPEEWTGDDAKSKHKLCQKDVDARWAKKGNETHYGYKNHVKADSKSKLIVDYTVTSASVHDSNEFKNLVKSGDKVVYADSGYIGKEGEIPNDVEAKICARACRNKPLTAEQKLWNKSVTKTRCRIEHIFGFMTNSLHGLFVRSVGMIRASFNIDLINLIYNMFRLETLQRCCA